MALEDEDRLAEVRQADAGRKPGHTGPDDHGFEVPAVQGIQGNWKCAPVLDSGSIELGQEVFRGAVEGGQFLIFLLRNLDAVLLA